MLNRLLRNLLLFGFLGLGINLAVAWFIAGLIDVEAAPQQSAQAFEGEGLWSVTSNSRRGAMRIRSVRMTGLNWSPQQATGAPDTAGYGDLVTAWASSSADGSPEWLVLEYAKAVAPREVHVYETNAPGAVTRISVFDENDKEIAAWSGTDPTPTSARGGISKIPLSAPTPTRKIKLYIASDKVPGWNEIDAVGLVSDTGELQWGRRAWASSTYASSSSVASSAIPPAALVPPWAGVERPTREMAEGLVAREEYLVDARGWPMLTVMSRRDLLAATRVPRSASPAAQPSQTIASEADYLVSDGSLSSMPPSGRTTALGPVFPAGGSAGPSSGTLALPMLPIWRGLLVNTAFYGGGLFLIWSGLVIPRRFLREVARFRSGCCIRCGYDLGYDFIKGCPECGWRRTDGSQRP